jgi:hypothetical protein
MNTAAFGPKTVDDALRVALRSALEAVSAAGVAA